MTEITTKIQRVDTGGQSKHSTAVPQAIIALAELQKGDVLVWKLDGDKIIIRPNRKKEEITDA